MSSSFYIWDAKQHHPDVEINDLQQAEYYAITPQDIGFTEKFKQWLIEVASIVNNPELSDNFNEKIIEFWGNAQHLSNYTYNILVVDADMMDDSRYLYKILIETLRKHDLVAYEARHLVFFSHDHIFPNQQQIEHMLQDIKPITYAQLEQFKVLPLNADQLYEVVNKWLCKNALPIPFVKEDRFKIIRRLSLNIEEEIGVLVGRFEINTFSFKTNIKISESLNLRFLREHSINEYIFQYFPEHLEKKARPSRFTQASQLQSVMQQLQEYLIYSAEQQKDLHTFNQWINHGNEKGYIKGLNVISRLVLAKYLNDSLYDQLVEEALPYVHRNNSFNHMTLEQFHERLEQEIKKYLPS